ncbi:MULTISPECIES: fimbrillin family protein [unclassified Butyricimonas]|uniref:fimbrillin family protein n=1 Tax=unclassified Butyricimonas TaxID=2637652 RepID=UPI000C07C97A|nr:MULTISPECIES: fimbrillin family protein [unclassified Butyricimonas]
MKKMIFSLLAIAAMTSCTTTSEDEIDPNAPVEINFGAGINMMSRAIIESNDAGLVTNAITGIQILRGADGATPKFNEVASVTTTGDLQTNGTFTNITTAQYFKSPTEAANFIAYYPAGETLEAGKVSYTIDGTTDIIIADAVKLPFSTTDKTVNFLFKHKLARLKLVVKAATSEAATFYGNLTAAKINVPTALDMTFDEAGVSTLDANATPVNADLDFGQVTLATGDGVSPTADLMLLPATLTKINLTFEHVAAKNYTINNLSLVAGNITTLTITVNEIGVEFTSAVSKWETGGTNGTTTVE